MLSFLFRQIRSVRAELDDLAKKVSALFRRQELEAIQGAMGPKQGRWYKCRNGHPYYVGNCGRPAQSAICNECHAPIGTGGGTAIMSLNGT